MPRSHSLYAGCKTPDGKPVFLLEAHREGNADVDGFLRSRQRVTSQRSVPLRLRRLAHPRFPDVGRLPHHALATLAAEQLDGVVIVDMAELSLVDAVTA